MKSSALFLTSFWLNYKLLLRFKDNLVQFFFEVYRLSSLCSRQILIAFSTSHEDVLAVFSYHGAPLSHGFNQRFHRPQKLHTWIRLRSYKTFPKFIQLLSLWNPSQNYFHKAQHHSPYHSLIAGLHVILLLNKSISVTSLTYKITFILDPSPTVCHDSWLRHSKVCYSILSPTYHSISTSKPDNG